MPVFETSQEWLHQSTLLFQAYPTTSRITTKYTIHPPGARKQRKRKRGADTEKDHSATETDATQQETTTDTNAAKTTAAPKATLTLKTYDPDSGVCLKYRTDKGAEVGRLIASMGKLGKHMAARPHADAEEVETAALNTDAASTAAVPGDSANAAASSTAAPSKPGGAAPGTAAAGGWGNKKKKKGKK